MCVDTERVNPRTADIDRLDTLGMVARINEEDRRCAEAVNAVLPEVARSVDIICAQLGRGGRLFYCGAGTSGRLGVLDAAECPPTYGVDPGLVVGLIAGGPEALVRAIEGAEDDPELGAADLKAHGFGPDDVLVGIAASGRTPYVLGAMAYASSVGAPVLALTCAADSEMSKLARVTMAPLPGPEVIAGSSRMKSGTCQKLVLNMLSTCTMIHLGKVYGNLMVDVKATNRKLMGRAVSIVRSVTGADERAALDALGACGYACKTAIVMLMKDLDAEQAEAALARAEGRLARALESDGE